MSGLLKKIVGFQNSTSQLYQPLFRLADWNIHGYEVLLQYKILGSNILCNKVAKDHNQIFQAETFSMKQSLIANIHSKNKLLFFKVSTSTLCHPNFKYFIDSLFKKFEIPTKRTVIEIHEKNSQIMEKISKSKKVLSFLKQSGFLISFVDVDSQQTTFKKIAIFEPEYIKLKKSFAKNLMNSEENQRIIREFVNKYRNDIHVVLGGIEEPTSLALAKYIGVPFVQGDLLGEPINLTKNRVCF
ncbi:EAL domain-containing protein [Schinkia sp. CFF1]